MKKNFYTSECSPQVNTRIMRVIEELVCRYRSHLPNGWRVIIKFQRSFDKIPYYYLDLESNKGGGEYAQVKMEMMELMPNQYESGAASPKDIGIALTNADIPDDLFDCLAMEYEDISEMSDSDWDILKNFGVTKWRGGIRIPYDILVTEHSEADEECMEAKQDIIQTTGEIRIAFSGAKEWQDVYFALMIFKGIQQILNELWDCDQIWFNLRELEKSPVAGFWLTNMKISEAPLIW